eukprot:scaffold182375_cov32-Tisochrysis_lutea.AAC.1
MMRAQSSRVLFGLVPWSADGARDEDMLTGTSCTDDTPCARKLHARSPEAAHEGHAAHALA